jgi:uncharacterized membrane protein YqjE
MQAREYIRSVYREIMREQPHRQVYPQGAFLAAALEIIQEVRSPVKEETLVRLAVLELEEERSRALDLKAVG